MRKTRSKSRRVRRVTRRKGGNGKNKKTWLQTVTNVPRKCFRGFCPEIYGNKEEPGYLSLLEEQHEAFKKGKAELAAAAAAAANKAAAEKEAAEIAARRGAPKKAAEAAEAAALKAEKVANEARKHYHAALVRAYTSGLQGTLSETLRYLAERAENAQQKATLLRREATALTEEAELFRGRQMAASSPVRRRAASVEKEIAKLNKAEERIRTMRGLSHGQLVHGPAI